MICKDGKVIFEVGEVATIIDGRGKRFWEYDLNDWIGKNITISMVKSDSYGYFYRSKQTSGTNIDEAFLKPANVFDTEPDNESEISQPQMHSFLSGFKVV